MAWVLEFLSPQTRNETCGLVLLYFGDVVLSYHEKKQMEKEHM